MINWLVSLGFPTSGELAFITEAVAGCLTVIIVTLTASCLFGIANAIFRK